MKDVVIPSVTHTQACVILGISPGALQALVDSGKLKEERVGDLVRFTHEAIADCISELSKKGLKEDG